MSAAYWNDLARRLRDDPLALEKEYAERLSRMVIPAAPTEPLPWDETDDDSEDNEGHDQ